MPPETTIPEHFHTSDRINWRDIVGKRGWLSHTLVGTAAATAGNYGVFFIAPFACAVREIREVHQVAGTDAGAVTVQVEKLTGTQAPDAGVTLLSSAISLKGTINTVVTGTLTGVLADLQLARGDRLALKDSGTLTAVDTVSITLELLVS